MQTRQPKQQIVDQAVAYYALSHPVKRRSFFRGLHTRTVFSFISGAIALSVSNITLPQSSRIETLADNNVQATSSGCEVVIFPTIGIAETSWEVCWATVPDHGLIISSARFSVFSSRVSIQVLGDTRLSELLVPYHSGEPRFFDISIDSESPSSLTLSSTDCLPSVGGILIGSDQVCLQVRDRGLAWTDNSSPRRVRRGEELVLWGMLDGGNYRYILEWSFQDDGAIIARAGATGPKLGGEDDHRGHMHMFSWRINIDLNGPDGDSVFTTRHVEPCSGNPLKACDSSTLISTERGVVWNPREFTTLEIFDETLRNCSVPSRPTSYELIPWRSGTARHFATDPTFNVDERYTQKDFWVTRFDGAELLAKKLPVYVNGEDVREKDVVIWYTGGLHHKEMMKDEDRQTVPVKWVGFELVPQNLFCKTPLYP